VPTGEGTTWRPWLASRVLYGVASLVAFGLIPITVSQIVRPCSGDACWAGDGRWWSLLGLPVLVAAGTWLMSVIFLMARLEGDRLVFRNPWWRSTSIQLATITGASTANYTGLRIERSDGKTVTVWALQKTNLARLLGRETRADRANRQILAAADAARSAQSPLRGPAP
jgi:hypothetical protein